MEDETLKVEPQYILDRNTKWLRNRTIEDVLVKWDAYPIEDTSWVDLDALLIIASGLVALACSLEIFMTCLTKSELNRQTSTRNPVSRALH